MENYTIRYTRGSSYTGVRVVCQGHRARRLTGSVFKVKACMGNLGREASAGCVLFLGKMSDIVYVESLPSTESSLIIRNVRQAMIFWNVQLNRAKIESSLLGMDLDSTIARSTICAQNVELNSIQC